MWNPACAGPKVEAAIRTSAAQTLRVVFLKRNFQALKIPFLQPPSAAQILPHNEGSIPCREKNLRQILTNLRAVERRRAPLPPCGARISQPPRTARAGAAVDVVHRCSGKGGEFPSRFVLSPTVKVCWKRREVIRFLEQRAAKRVHTGNAGRRCAGSN